MKKLILSSLLIFYSYSFLSAEIFFPDTAPQTQTENNYSESKVKKQPIITVNVFPNQLYYAFIAPGEMTIINCPYPIKDVVIGGKDIVSIEYKKDANFLTAKATGEFFNQDTTLQVICQNGFKAVLFIKITKKEDSNKIINLLDGRDSKNSIAYNEDSFKKFKQAADFELKKREETMTFFFFNDATKFKVDKKIDIEDSFVSLSNICICNTTYFFNLEFQGKDDLVIDKKNIFLYLTNFTSFIFNEFENNKVLLKPKDIFVFKSDTGKQLITISFEVEKKDITQTFYSELYLSKNIIFKTKVDLDMMNSSNKNLLDLKVR